MVTTIKSLSMRKQMERKEVIEISSSSSESEPESECGSPVRSVLCIKKNSDLETFDDSEDCVILDFDPYEFLNFSELSLSKDEDVDIAVISEKGQVACRDYPHARHLCTEFPFNDSPHQSYCKQCYCYVCDKVAPCPLWTEPQPGHCHASDIGEWMLQRNETLKKMKDMQTLMAKEDTSSAAVAPKVEEEEGEIDETEFVPGDIDLVMKQAGVTRSQAVKALKTYDGDVMDAIMDLNTYI